MSKKEILAKIALNGKKIRLLGATKIGLFGSYARGSGTKKSDIDILVEFSQKTFDNYMNLKFFLEKIFNAKVDLVISDALKPQLKPKILKEVIYAQGI